MHFIKKMIIILCLINVLPQVIDISAQPLDSKIIADKSVQSED